MVVNFADSMRSPAPTSSFRPIGQKSALRIKFAKDQRPYGLKSLTLNNMVSDRSLVHETLGYELFRAAGVPAPLTGYAYVRINGAGYGLYLNIEPYDDVSLKRMFGGAGSLLGAFVGSFVVGFLYNFGIALVPDLAYFVLFLPMLLLPAIACLLLMNHGIGTGMAVLAAVLVGCIGLNIFGNTVTEKFGLILFLDMIGTATAAMRVPNVWRRSWKRTSRTPARRSAAL